jgi:hypothetical protein
MTPKAVSPEPTQSAPAAPPASGPERKLICATRGSTISIAEGKYC